MRRGGAGQPRPPRQGGGGGGGHPGEAPPGRGANRRFGAPLRGARGEGCANTGGPGCGDNGRVRKWGGERLEGGAEAGETPIGLVPAPGAIDTEGLDMAPDDVTKAVAVDLDEWRAELPLIEEWFAKIGDRLPAQLHAELDGLKERLA